MEAKKHMELLGMTVKDKVTGFKGVVTSMSFDLYGCVQGVVTPPADKEGKQENGRWFDVARLDVILKTRVMPMPDYDLGYVAQGKKGAAEKPVGKWLVLFLALMLTGCSTIKNWTVDRINLEEDFKSFLLENIPEAARLFSSTTEKSGDKHTGVQVVKWAKGQDRGYVFVEIWDLQPPVENNVIGPEYYLWYSRGEDVRRGDTMTMARRGSRNEIRTYFECYDPKYGRKRCATVHSTYPNTWTKLEWEWKPGGMEFRVNGESVRYSPTKDYQGKIKSLWVPGCPHAGRVYPCEWRGMIIQTPDKPSSGGAEFWKAL